jgi:hypothetical protein
VRLRIECCTADIKPKKTACINCHKVQRERAAATSVRDAL